MPRGYSPPLDATLSPQSATCIPPPHIDPTAFRTHFLHLHEMPAYQTPPSLHQDRSSTTPDRRKRHQARTKRLRSLMKLLVSVCRNMKPRNQDLSHQSTPPPPQAQMQKLNEKASSGQGRPQSPLRLQLYTISATFLSNPIRK